MSAFDDEQTDATTFVDAMVGARVIQALLTVMWVMRLFVGVGVRAGWVRRRA